MQNLLLWCQSAFCLRSVKIHYFLDFSGAALCVTVEASIKRVDLNIEVLWSTVYRL